MYDYLLGTKFSKKFDVYSLRLFLRFILVLFFSFLCSRSDIKVWNFVNLVVRFSNVLICVVSFCSFFNIVS